MTPQQLPTLDELTVDRGSRVLLRADLNVPVSDGRVTDDYRIRVSLPTIRWLRERGATVVICAHRGRPGGRVDQDLSLAPITSTLGDLLGCDVPLAAADVAGDESAHIVDAAKPGEVILLENLRFDPGERSADDAFVERLSRLADSYVNDAFGACHRAHASVVGPPGRLPAAAGFLLHREVDVLTGLRQHPERPFIALLGGAKLAGKLGVVDALLQRCDRLLIGGALAFTFLAAAGHDVAASPVDETHLDECRELLRSKRLELPVDLVAAEALDDAAPRRVVTPDNIPAGWMGADIGPQTAQTFADGCGQGKSVFWNRPMGAFEHAPFAGGTRRVATAVAASPAFTVVGGGDTVAALRQWRLADPVSHVSTGGGVALNLLATGDLPGLEALRARPID